jgi:CoA:oxalate CoA-transferase
MQEELSAVLRTRDAEDWEAQLSEAGIPCGMVRDIHEAMSLPALDARSLTVPVRIPGLPDNEQVAILDLGILGSHDDRGELEPPPRLGQHTEEIRAWLDQP